ncbi:MAG: DNA polymerase IV [Omnitrophica bacterium]|nr:DNA polymerase IV [Candidatus Omnitrophota bacterium]
MNPTFRAKKFIVHVDMDAFFAAIEQRDNPAFRGKPVVVGADPKKGRGRGVVSTCSYEARKFGIHSAMPISIAYRKCPEAIFLPVNSKKYSRVSGRIYGIFHSFTPDVEPISIDEAFLDITGSFHLFGARAKALRSVPRDTCMLIKARIKKETGLTASVGLAPTKMAAKIASELQKPDGFVEVTEKGLRDFLDPLDISRLWGLGKKSEAVFRRMGINTIGDIAKKDVRDLISAFGKNGAHFWNLANGIDERAVETARCAKSVSNEVTFDKDTLDRRKIEGALMYLCEKVSMRLRAAGLKTKTITLKIRLTGFYTSTRAVTVERTNFANVLYKTAERLYNDFDKGNKAVRLLGVKASNLSERDFPDTLFRDASDDKNEEIHKAVDRIKEKFGEASIHRASAI